VQTADWRVTAAFDAPLNGSALTVVRSCRREGMQSIAVDGGSYATGAAVVIAHLRLAHRGCIGIVSVGSYA
jgi:hypothetical protein